MSARTFISLMLLLMVFAASLFVFAAPAQKEAQKKECPAGAACEDEIQTKSGDVMVWDAVSRHLLSMVNN